MLFDTFDICFVTISIKASQEEMDCFREIMERADRDAEAYYNANRPEKEDPDEIFPNLIREKKFFENLVEYTGVGTVNEADSGIYVDGSHYCSKGNAAVHSDWKVDEEVKFSVLVEEAPMLDLWRKMVEKNMPSGKLTYISRNSYVEDFYTNDPRLKDGIYVTMPDSESSSAEIMTPIEAHDALVAYLKKLGKAVNETATIRELENEYCNDTEGWHFEHYDYVGPDDYYVCRPEPDEYDERNIVSNPGVGNIVSVDRMWEMLMAYFRETGDPVEETISLPDLISKAREKDWEVSSLYYYR